VNTEVERVINEVRAWPPEAIYELTAKLNEMTAPGSRAEADLLERLRARGVISEPQQLPTTDDIKAFHDYQPVFVTGRPVSETIIEERG
jgi:hypothetical protein